MRPLFLMACVLLVVFSGCSKAPEPEAAPSQSAPPRVFGPYEIRPRIDFVGDWKPATRCYLNVQLEAVKRNPGEPATLTNAEVDESFFPTITAVFFEEGKELSRLDLSTERSC